MKSLQLLTLLSLAFIASSCRTVTPLDPMTMKQSTRCLPGNFEPQGSYSAECYKSSK